MLTIYHLVARVKKIIHADDDIQSCSNNAAFVITIATEMFVQHLVEKTHEIIKAEKRPRRNVQYSDVGMLQTRLTRGYNLHSTSERGRPPRPS
jgi:DNA polymerase epsilon subunit 4